MRLNAKIILFLLLASFVGWSEPSLADTREYAIKLRVSADKLGEARLIHIDCKLYDQKGQKGVVVAFTQTAEVTLPVTNGKVAPQLKTVSLKTDQEVQSWQCELRPDPPSRKFSSTSTDPNLKVTRGSVLVRKGNLN